MIRGTIPLPRGQRRLQHADVHILRVVAGMDMLKFATLSQDGNVEIGRTDDCQLALHHGSISRLHARVQRTKQGVELVDLGSTNGTTVNGQVVKKAVLRAGDRLLIGSVSVRYDLLTQEELEHLSLIAQRVHDSAYDSLTGLLTRHGFDKRLEKTLENAREKGQLASCLFLDVDRFKEINDMHGHLVGDEVLSSVAKLIHLAVRRDDPCIRFGGDETLILAEDTDERRMELIGERILGTLRNHDWGATLPDLKVTASCGAAQWNGRELANQWIGRADQALLAAKRAGSDRVLRASNLTQES